MPPGTFQCRAFCWAQSAAAKMRAKARRTGHKVARVGLHKRFTPENLEPT
jgi:hypothetical protein